MQFVPGGPDIPEHLLQAQEDGRVVFFCGAGISYPAGLPGFKGLVDDIYRRVGTSPTPIEQKAYDRSQYDAMLDLLERRIPGQRIAVRTALVQALQPNLRRRGAADTHIALLQLAYCRDGALRLVTTNFDRVFERAAKRAKFDLHGYVAPMLPIPKNSRWNGLVYLHGLMPEKEDNSALHRLVLTSGDFGLAYLTERWAARFVSELFQNYVVCFVGYSINDPVLRYMMDALAADRMLGEITPQAYALGDCEHGQEHGETNEWKAKGVTPILYEVPVGSRNHSALHRTLKVWGETYRDGILGKERVIVDYAVTRPSASTRQDDFVGRMLWALSHESGLPAKRFAEFNPAPPLEWLEALSEERYQHGDLNRFGVPTRPDVDLSDVDSKLRFSLIRRPASYQHAPWMALVSGGAPGSQWDDVMYQLGRWLVRHLNDPALIIWLAQRGGQLHDRWHWLIEREMDQLARLQQQGGKSELDEIRAHAPNAIPGPLMETLWRVFLTGRVKSPTPPQNSYYWKDRLRRHGLTFTLRLELRELLAPRVALRKPFGWDVDKETTNGATRIRQLVDWDLVLATDHVHSFFRDIADDRWRTALPALLDDFQQLLCDALDLLHELGEADAQGDRSRWDLPSISPHPQNQEFRDWVVLIEMLRDSWLAVRENNPERARRIALIWFDLPYSTFKRLALFAAAQDDCIEPSQWVEWLTSNDARWLWSFDTRRETMRLLVLQGGKLTTVSRETLEAAILAGPPRRMYRDDLEPKGWQSLTEHAIWLYLAKLRDGGGELGAAALQQFRNLSIANPEWKLATNEQDEFSFWVSGDGDPDFEASRVIDQSPRKRTDLVRWLKNPPKSHPLYEDTWLETCRTRFFHALFALCDLAQEGLWPSDRWEKALQVWSEEGLALRSWRFAAPLVQAMPESVLVANAHSVTRWLEVAAKALEHHESILLDLCERILSLHLEPSTGIFENGKPINDPLTEAINHPIGRATQALLNLWFKRRPGDNELLPSDVEPFFTKLCNVGVEEFRHGRVLLASRLIALFRVDRSWTETNLLPLFDWGQSSVEAKAAWEGFLWSPRLYPPLMIAFKSQFLSTAHHYADLGEHSQRFAAFLTYAALGSIDGYTLEEFGAAIAGLPQEGLHEVARTLSQVLEGAGEKREDYWKNRIKPFWHRSWPKSRDLVSGNIAESLARMCLAAGREFPSALAIVADWLLPIEYPHYIVQRLHESGLCAEVPNPSLRLLDRIIDDQPWAPRELGLCLDAIAIASPALRQDPRYKRLVEYQRRRES